MPNWLKQRAYLTPNRLALLFKGEQWSYQALYNESIAMAQRLYHIGIRKGDHVAFLMENKPYTVMLIHALHFLGAVMVPLNKRLTHTEINFQINDAEARHLVYDAEHAYKAEYLKGAASKINVQKLQEIEVPPNGSPPPYDTEIDLERSHSILYTSGTTGKPKGVILTYGNHWWSAVGSALNLGLSPADRWLCAVPLFHVSGLSIVIRSVIYGTSMVLHAQFEAEAMNQSIIRDQVSIASVVSVMLANMLDQLGSAIYPESFRCMLLGGGPAPLTILEACKRKHIPVYQTYGMTETASQIVTLSPEDSLAKIGSAGKPLFPAQVKIVDTYGQELPFESEGEITVKGPNVTQSYFKRKDATAEVMLDGWLKTGDMGYFDADGFLYVLDRRKDLIISGGENVYPAEIEDCLLKHPAVAEAGVVGVDDAQWGSVPAAFVVLHPGERMSESDIVAHCTSYLAAYKIPKYVQFEQDIPRNASNKIVRRRLIERFKR